MANGSLHDAGNSNINNLQSWILKMPSYPNLIHNGKTQKSNELF